MNTNDANVDVMYQTVMYTQISSRCLQGLVCDKVDGVERLRIEVGLTLLVLVIFELYLTLIFAFCSSLPPSLSFSLSLYLFLSLSLRCLLCAGKAIIFCCRSSLSSSSCSTSSDSLSSFSSAFAPHTDAVAKRKRSIGRAV